MRCILRTVGRSLRSKYRVSNSGDHFWAEVWYWYMPVWMPVSNSNEKPRSFDAAVDDLLSYKSATATKGSQV